MFIKNSKFEINSNKYQSSRKGFSLKGILPPDIIVEAYFTPLFQP